MLLQIGVAYLLQNGAGVITNWGSYCKLVQILLQIGAITTKGMTTAKKSFNKSNDYYLFHESSKKTARRFFKEVFMHYLCKKLP